MGNSNDWTNNLVGDTLLEFGVVSTNYGRRCVVDNGRGVVNGEVREDLKIGESSIPLSSVVFCVSDEVLELISLSLAMASLTGDVPSDVLLLGIVGTHFQCSGNYSFKIIFLLLVCQYHKQFTKESQMCMLFNFELGGYGMFQTTKIYTISSRWHGSNV